MCVNDSSFFSKLIPLFLLKRDPSQIQVTLWRKVFLTLKAEFII